MLRRKIVQDDTCESHGMGSENSGHIFWSCLNAQEAWSYSKMVLRSKQGDRQTFLDLLWNALMVEGAGEDKAARVITMACALWHNLNEVRHGGESKFGQAVAQWATHYLTEYSMAMEATAISNPVVEQRTSWSPPAPGCLKVNVDGAIVSAQRTAGIKVVIRNEDGSFKAVLSKKIMALLGAVDAEVKAFEASLLLANDLGVHDIVLEGDSMIIHNALCERSPPPTSVAAVIMGIQDLCKDFRRIEFTHVRRQSNRLAHLLAKHASSIVDCIVWIEEIPCCIEQALIHDVLSFSNVQ